MCEELNSSSRNKKINLQEIGISFLKVSLKTRWITPGAGSRDNEELCVNHYAKLEDRLHPQRHNISYHSNGIFLFGARHSSPLHSSLLLPNCSRSFLVGKERNGYPYRSRQFSTIL